MFSYFPWVKSRMLFLDTIIFLKLLQILYKEHVILDMMVNLNYQLEITGGKGL